ncbi:MAG: hypothetical protein AAFY71_22615 [Bacteroidota bacterium]
MKRIIITLTAVLFSLATFAQTNIVKIAPLKLVNSKLALGYERPLSEKTSINVGLQIVLPSGFNNFNTNLQESFRQTYPNLNGLQDGGISRGVGFKVTPEFRFYTGGNAPEGFYLAVMGRISRSDYEYESSYITNDRSETVVFTFAAPSTTLGAAVGLGFQKKLGENFLIDWNLNAGAAANLVSLRGKVDAPSVEAINELITELEVALEEPGIFDRVTTNSVDQSFGTGNIPAPLLISRLSVGYFF